MLKITVEFVKILMLQLAHLQSAFLIAQMGNIIMQHKTFV